MSNLPSWLVSRRWLVVPPVVVGIAVLAFAASRKKELPRNDVQEVAVPISVVKIVYQPVQPMAVGYGTTQAARTWTAVSEVAGRIVRTHPDLESGKSIRAGEVLLEVDRTDYEIQLRQRQADYDKAVASEKELEASQLADQKSLGIEEELLVVTQTDFERQLGLRRDNMISETGLENAKSSLLRQRQSVQQLHRTISLYPSKIAAAQAAVSLANSRLEEANRNLEKTQIVAPFSGTLAGVDLEPNQVVTMNERLFELWDASVIEVEAQFSPSQLAGLLPGGVSRYQRDKTAMLSVLEAEMVVRSGDFQQSFLARPVRLGESVDQRTRTLSVVVQLEMTSNELVEEQLDKSTTDESLLDRAPLLSGAFCEVILRGPQQTASLAVPRTALEDGHVYVVDNDNRLHRKKVTTGATIGDIRTVTDGIEEGAVVAVRPPVPAIDGQLVAPQVLNLQLPPEPALSPVNLLRTRSEVQP